MSTQTLEWREDRAKLIADARKLFDDATKDGGKMEPDQNAKFDKMMADSTTLLEKIEQAEKLESLEKDLNKPLDVKSKVDVTDTGKPKHVLASPEYRDAFIGLIKSGKESLDPSQQAVLEKGYKAALQMDIDVSGGYLVTPQETAMALIKAVDDLVFIRQFAHKETVVKAASLGIVSLDQDPDDGDWTSELKTGDETDIALGKRELNPHPLAKRALISNKLLRANFMDPEALLLSRLAYKFAVTHEKAFLTGSGANQPLGIMTPSNDGIPVSRDIVGGSTTALTFDGLKDAKYALKAQYWPNARWIFHRDAIAQLAKIKDGDGRYMWVDSVREGEPDMLLGRPVLASEYMPNTFTAGQYVGCFADLSFYWIADALDMQVQRLVELYSATNQTGYHLRNETDGMPVLGEAFSRIKLAAS